MRIRKATSQDARIIAELADMAAEGLEVADWRQKAGGQVDPLAVGQQVALDPKSHLYFENAYFAEDDNQIQGMVLVRKIPEESLEDIAPILEKEPEAIVLWELEQQITDHLAIEILAVYEDFRQKGLGQKLLDHAVQLTKDRGYEKLSLLAFEENQKAVPLYIRNGFEIMDRRPIPEEFDIPYTGDLVLMTKTIT